VADRKADAQTGQRAGFGQGVDDQQVVIALDQRNGRSAAEVDIGLVDDNDRVGVGLQDLLDGFEGKLTSSKWAAIAKCSPDTALRDITQLLELGVLKKSPGGGRSTGYELAGQ